ncbi:MAG: amino acid racemase [Acidobacteriota bacterium]
MSAKAAGIIGGMGPEATVDLMLRVIRATPARDDADHIRMIVDSDPKIPSRIEALLEGTGESPGPYLAETGRRLESWGAAFLAMPCNTAHYYHGEIQAAVGIPVLHMIDLTAARVAGGHQALRHAGVLAATAVIRTGLYAAAFERLGRRVLYPGDALQDRLMEAIRTIKAGRHGRAESETLQAAADHLVKAGAQALIVACTELSVIAGGLTSGVAVFDASQVLAESIVREATA